MTVRCKFKVDSIEKSLNGDKKELATVKMTPVYDSNPESENGRFWKYSPSGSFSVGSVNVAAIDSLELGGEYYIDITPATKP